MKSFQFYIDDEKVRKVAPNPALAKGLCASSKKRIEAVKHIPVREITVTIIVENYYESIREALESHLAKKGYKSYSHTATIAFALENKLLSQEEEAYINNLKDLRNESRYEAKTSTLEDAKKAAERVPKIVARLVKK